MSFIKYFHYVYLIFAAFFLYDSVLKFQNGESVVISLVLAVAAVFMFFFRGHFNNKFRK